MNNFLVFISGNGSNLKSMINACKTKNITAKISAVFSDNPAAMGLTIAKQAAIPTIVIPKDKYKDNHAYDASIIAAIAPYQPDLIVLAGYMRILTSLFVRSYLGKIINIHPSLLPKYPGLYPYLKVLDNGDQVHGTSVHFVTEQVDAGPIILQAKVPIFPSDQHQDIISRVQKQEYRIYPIVIDWFMKGRLKMINHVAYLNGYRLPSCGYTNDICLNNHL